MAPRVPVAPTLELIAKFGSGRMYELDERPLTIGRDRTSGVCLSDRCVSTFHARVIRREDGAYLVEDLNSSNLTILDGQKLAPYTPAVLMDGSRIRICGFVFVFRLAAVEVREEEVGDDTILGTLADMSAHKLSSRADRAATVLRAVLAINRLLGGATALNEVLMRALSELFAIFGQADCGFILTAEPDGKFIPRATLHRENAPALSLSTTVLDHVLRERKALIVSTVSGSALGTSDSFSGGGIRTALCVPILGREGKALGIIQLDSQLKKVPFGAEDLELLAAVAVPIGVVVENHGLWRDRAALSAAAEVQAAQLPKRRPTPPGYTFWDYYQPALEVGGDYYDYIPEGAGRRAVAPAWPRWAVAVGDVAGKGMPAAIMVAGLSAEVRHLVRSGAGPVEVADVVNLDLYEAAVPGRFVTFLLALFDATTHRFSLVNAGHMWPIVRRASGVLESWSGAESGMPLGVEPATVYGAVALALGPGDVVVMYTDGVTDAANRHDEMFGLQGLERVVSETAGGPAEVGAAIARAVRNHAAGRDQVDDVAILCFGRDGGPVSGTS